jgi:hypothetical protein
MLGLCSPQKVQEKFFSTGVSIHVQKASIARTSRFGLNPLADEIRWRPLSEKRVTW